MPSREMVIAANRIGVTLMEDNAAWTNRFQIRSESSSRMYTIAQRKTNGEWACDCMSWKRARDGVRSCKHLNAIIHQLPKCVPVTKLGSR